MPLAFAFLGAAVLFVVSGLKGGTIADAFAGRLNSPLDPKGGPGSQPLNIFADVGTTQDLQNPVADALNATAQGIDVKKVGTVQWDGGPPVAAWIAPILTYARRHGWHGNVTSGYRSAAEQARICATGVKPCAEPGKSNHQSVVFPGGAVDVTDAAQLSNILKNSPYRDILVWAGAKDPVHFSHPHGGSY